MGPYQRTPKKGTRAIQYPGLGVRSVGPVGDFLDDSIQKRPKMWVKDGAAITEPAACRPVPLVVLHWCCPATGSKDETWPVDAQKPGENRPAMSQAWEKEMPNLINLKSPYDMQDLDKNQHRLN